MFSNPVLVDEVVHELEANGFARQDIRILGEALSLTEVGPTSIAHTDFEIDVIREFKSIGADQSDAEGYIQGLRVAGIIAMILVRTCPTRKLAEPLISSAWVRPQTPRVHGVAQRLSCDHAACEHNAQAPESEYSTTSSKRLASSSKAS